MIRKIIEITEEKCDGCGQCLPECPEGAIQIIDGKARLISDLFCDGLGACIGYCPTGAIQVIEREAMAYDEKQVMENVVRQGANTIKAHLQHLYDHGEKEFLSQAVTYLEDNQLPVPEIEKKVTQCAEGPACAGSGSTVLIEHIQLPAQSEEVPSALSHWPIQMHLVSPMAPHFSNTDLILAADCVAYAIGSFHQNFLPRKTLTIACPKLDEQQQVYLEKLKALIEMAKINTLTVMIMQVPCCRGLLMLAKEALNQSSRKIPVKLMVVGVQGVILQDQWVS
jgi:ferredoxin